MSLLNCSLLAVHDW